jgi:hypothetical protein
MSELAKLWEENARFRDIARRLHELRKAPYNPRDLFALLDELEREAGVK